MRLWHNIRDYDTIHTGKSLKFAQLNLFQNVDKKHTKMTRVVKTKCERAKNSKKIKYNNHLYFSQHFDRRLR